MKRRTPKWLRWQRGQALVEYWPTIPAAIALMLSAGLLVQWITGGLLTIIDYTNPTEYVCEEETPDTDYEGPIETPEFEHHEIIITSRTYDPDTDTTTVTYKVTNVPSPDISHWTLGMPPGVRKHIKWTSEAYENVDNDPHNHITGIKFDRGYGEGGGKTDLGGYALIGYNFRAAPAESRDIIIHLGGYYDWGMVEVGVKGGKIIETSHITGPVRQIDPPEGECVAESDE